MEPFQLICSSCAAKLKVRRQSAIGQRLACPRCGQMVLVQAPAGHELADVGETDGVSASMNFDDMDLDAILENKKATKPVNQRESKSPQLGSAPQPDSVAKSNIQSQSRLDLPSPKQARKSQKSRSDSREPRHGNVARPSSPTPNQTAVEPVVPGEQWVNPATRKKQRTLIFLAIGIAGLLSLAVGGYAIVYALTSEIGTGDSKQVAVAAIDPVLKDDNQALDAEAAANDTGDIGSNSKVDSNRDADSNPDLESELNALQDAAAVVDSSPPEIEFDAPKIGADPAPATDSGFDFPPSSDGGTTGEPSVEIPSPEADAGDDVEPVVADSSAAEIEAIREILEQNGTSLSKVRSEAAAAPYRGKVGLPKYAFKKSDFEAVDFQKQKRMLLPGVSYKSLPLQAVLHELTKISGLVIAIDVPLLIASGADLNPEITLTLEDQDVSTVVNAIADSVSMSAVETDEGFLFTALDANQIESKNIDVSDLVDASVTGEEWTQLVTAMVFPNGWLTGGGDAVDGKGTIEFEQGSLLVTHQSMVIREVEKLVEAIRELKSGDDSTSPMLKPVISLADGEFAKPYAAKKTVRPALGQFLVELESEASVLAIVDWAALGESGWTPDSMASAWIDEPTVGEVVDEFAHSIEAGTYIIDDQTVWFTSWEKASNMFEVKLHSTSAIAGGKLNSRQLGRLLTDALAPQTRQAGVAVRLFDGGKMLFVRAPQAIQRQVRSILQTLR